MSTAIPLLFSEGTQVSQHSESFMPCRAREGDSFVVSSLSPHTVLAQHWAPYLKPTSAHHKKVTFINPKGSCPILLMYPQWAFSGIFFSQKRKEKEDSCKGSSLAGSLPLSTASITPHPPSQSEREVAQLCLTLWDPMDYIIHGILQTRILEWSPSLLQGIFPIQGSNSGLPSCRWILHQLSH